MMERFTYLKVGLAAVLVFVGAKMLIADLYHVPIWASLAVIAGCIGASIGVSLRRTAATEPTTPVEDRTPEPADRLS
jgi:tellurite resistance protein TerC